MYTPEKVYHISLYNNNYIMYSILTECHNQGLLNKPSYMFLPFLVLEVLLEQSKCSKHLTGFLRHCNCAIWGPVMVVLQGKKRATQEHP
jgi:hypothetical protein